MPGETSWWRGKLSRVPALAQRVRGWLLPLVISAALFGFARVLQPKFPIQDWCFWRYLEYWAVTLVWLTACFSFGHGLIKLLLRRSSLPVLERVTMNLAVGLLGFFLLMFVGGLARMYHSPLFFFGLPVLMLGCGGRSWIIYLKRLRRGLKRARAGGQRPFSVAPAFLWGIGLIALFLFYLPAIVPSNIGYDSGWYHVPLGEHYARLGRIGRFPEGWYSGAIPHLPSVVYCYAFLLPRGSVFDFVELSAHLEFGSLLMMLPGIPALVRRLAPGARAHWSWIAFFAFPSLYWYDCLIGGDQFSAVWSVPICLALLRTFPGLNWRYGLLLACTVAGEVLTKYSASGIVIGAALAIALRMPWLALVTLWRRRSPSAALRAISGGAVTGAAVLLLTTPLWAKNWLWYGEPFFPLLHGHFASRPWSPDASAYLADYQLEMKSWQPPPGLDGIKDSLRATLTHGWKPADFSEAPLRGALFTLMCFCVPFVRGPWRLWGTAAVLNVAVFSWYFQFHQDRYLMAFMPAMAAVAIAVAVLAWRVSLLARLSVMALFAFHTIWSLSIFGLSAPNGRYRSVLEYASAVASGAKDAGMGELARWERLGQAIPDKGRVLVHNMHFHTGLGHPSVSDWPRIQAGLSYGRTSSPTELYQQLRRMGVSHLLWSSPWEDDSIAGDLRFNEFVTKYAAPQNVEGLWLGTMPTFPPPPGPADPLIAFLGCDRYEAGLYRFSDMTVPNPRNIPQPPYPSPIEPITKKTQSSALARARYAVLNRNCGFEPEHELEEEFINIGQRSDYELYARKDVP